VTKGQALIDIEDGLNRRWSQRESNPAAPPGSQREIEWRVRAE
jgi:hypothetical protein